MLRNLKLGFSMVVGFALGACDLERTEEGKIRLEDDTIMDTVAVTRPPPDTSVRRTREPDRRQEEDQAR